MKPRQLHTLNRWQLPLWLFGASLPCVAVVVLGYYEFAHPDRYTFRDQLLTYGDWAVFAASMVGLTMMTLASVFADDSVFRRFLFVVISILVVPASMFAGCVASIVVNGLPVD